MARIEENGPLPFGDFVEASLYTPDLGFYAHSGRAGGRRGDFVTSVEVGPLFGAVLAGWLDDQWSAAGQPSSFAVSEIGAGVGTLWRTILRADPQCLGAISYTLVERSATQRRAHDELPGSGWRSSDELPAEPQAVILANELLDNLPFDIAERTAHGWAPVLVTGGQGRNGFEFVVGEVDDNLAHLLSLAPDAEIGTRVPVAARAHAFVTTMTERADKVLLFDYGATTAELAVRGIDGWLRTYVDHQRGHEPLRDLGRSDITHDVPVDQLPPPRRVSTQAQWLQQQSLPRLLEQARSVWRERAHIGDLAALTARSAVGEAEALTDPTGLGGFLVLEW